MYQQKGLPWVYLQFVSVAVPGHTHLLLFLSSQREYQCTSCLYVRISHLSDHVNDIMLIKDISYLSLLVTKQATPSDDSNQYDWTSVQDT